MLSFLLSGNLINLIHFEQLHHTYCSYQNTVEQKNDWVVLSEINIFIFIFDLFIFSILILFFPQINNIIFFLIVLFLELTFYFQYQVSYINTLKNGNQGYNYFQICVQLSNFNNYLFILQNYSYFISLSLIYLLFELLICNSVFSSIRYIVLILCSLPLISIPVNQPNMLRLGLLYLGYFFFCCCCVAVCCGLSTRSGIFYLFCFHYENEFYSLNKLINNTNSFNKIHRLLLQDQNQNFLLQFVLSLFLFNISINLLVIMKQMLKTQYLAMNTSFTSTPSSIFSNSNRFPAKCSLHNFLRNKKLKHQIEDIRRDKQIDKAFDILEAKAKIQQAQKNQYRFSIKSNSKPYKNLRRPRTSGDYIEKVPQLSIEKQPIRCKTQCKTNSKQKKLMEYSLIVIKKKTRKMVEFAPLSKSIIIQKLHQKNEFEEPVRMMTEVIGQTTSIGITRSKLNSRKQKKRTDTSYIRPTRHQNLSRSQPYTYNVTSRPEEKIIGWDTRNLHRQQTVQFGTK